MSAEINCFHCDPLNQKCLLLLPYYVATVEFGSDDIVKKWLGGAKDRGYMVKVDGMSKALQCDGRCTHYLPTLDE